MGFFSRKPQPTAVAPTPAIWEFNPHFGRPFNVAVQMCQDSEELTNLVTGYNMTTKELDCFCERLEVLYFDEDMALYELTVATPAAFATIAQTYGANHPRHQQLVNQHVADAVQLKRDTEQFRRATNELTYINGMRDALRHNELIAAIESNAPATLYGDIKSNPVIATVFGLAATRRHA